MDIIVASNNENKIREIKEIFKDKDVNIKSLKEINYVSDIEENGTTFEENSYIKAKTIYDLYHLPVIADDSGLSVDALGGEPGVYSHRYAGDNCDDKANNIKLINNLKQIDNRNAHFVCVITYIKSSGEKIVSRGEVHGLIIDEPKGENGFGYDPYFYIPLLNKTMAELTLEEKNKISHRSKALNKLKELI